MLAVTIRNVKYVKECIKNLKNNAKIALADAANLELALVELKKLKKLNKNIFLDIVNDHASFWMSPENLKDEEILYTLDIPSFSFRSYFILDDKKILLDYYEQAIFNVKNYDMSKRESILFYNNDANGLFNSEHSAKFTTAIIDYVNQYSSTQSWIAGKSYTHTIIFENLPERITKLLNFS